MPVLASARRPALHALLTGAIDYAGLFPPAALGMPEAVRSYLYYRRGPDAWALGRFVAPAERLSELADALVAAGGAANLRVAALVAAEPAADLARIATFHALSGAHGARVDAAEGKAGTPAQAGALLGALPSVWARYVEVPLDGRLESCLDAIAAAGGFAKVRTGGVTADAFPPPEALLGFLAGAVRRGLPFKATAGLHHPIRARYHLTYAPGGPEASMYGYLNLMLATALLAAGQSPDRARAALLEEDRAALRVQADALEWRGHRVPLGALRSLRRDLFHGFGSCSFREPVDEVALFA